MNVICNTLSPSPSPQARGTQNNLSYGEVNGYMSLSFGEGNRERVKTNLFANAGEGNVTTSGECNEYMSLSNGEGDRERVKTNPFANVERVKTNLSKNAKKGKINIFKIVEMVKNRLDSFSFFVKIKNPVKSILSANNKCTMLQLLSVYFLNCKEC